jgi:bifunctional DNA-binding transcriptional regulator/antitoxin component of YhaV-PrlF toxin-antitoxin module
MNTNQNPSYITECSEDENGNIVLDIPQELLETLGWSEGTILNIDACAGRIHMYEVEPESLPETGCIVDGKYGTEGGAATVEEI